MDFNAFKQRYEHKKVEEQPNQVPAQPVVSVCVMTYQHKPYIRQCLDGILMQKTDFPFEILLGDDASTDGTREICLEYANKYPDKIRLFLHHRENNIKIGGSPTGRFNFLYNLYAAKGKYIALCEGDDYWTDPLKLQKQVEFMEGNQDCSLCFHPVLNKFYNDQKQDIIIGPKIKQNHIFSSKEIIEGIFVRTVSMFLKAEIAKNLPEWIITCAYGDLPLQLVCASQGNFGYLGEKPMAVYRRGVPGAWSNKEGSTDYHEKLKWHKKRRQDHLFIFDTFNENTNQKYNEAIEVRKVKQIRGYLNLSLRVFKKKEQWRLIKKYFKYLLDLRKKLVLKFWIKFFLGQKTIKRVKKYR